MKEEPERLLAAPSAPALPPIQNKEKEDAYHNTYRITETVTDSPYTSQILFRGDIHTDKVTIIFPDKA